MKIFYLATLILSLYSRDSYSQSPGWEWLKGAKGNGVQEAAAVAVDLYDNLYLVGDLQTGADTLICDSLVVTCSQPNYNGRYSLVKYSPQGKALWARISYVTNDQGSAGMGVCTDPQGNVFATGFFDNSIVFDNTHILTGGSIFTVKYDSLGNVLWANQGFASSRAYPFSITSDRIGNSYITGSFSDEFIVFGSDTLRAAYIASTNLIPPANYFLTKYSPTGNVLWTRTIFSPCDTEIVTGGAVTTDQYNNIYVAGGFLADSIVIGGIPLYGSNTDYYEFLAKYDSQGNVLWAKNFGTGIGPSCIAVARDLSIYVSGGFSSSNMFTGAADVAILGPYILHNANPGALNTGNFFIAKHDNLGNVIWAKSGSTPGVSTTSWSMALNENDDVFVSGGFKNSITFDSTTTLTQPHNDTLDPMFIVSFDPNGNVICATSLPSGGDDNNGIALDHKGNIYVGGDFFSNIYIPGVDTLIKSTTTGEFFFVAKYNCGIKLNGISEITSPIAIHPNPSTGTFYFSGLNAGSSVEIYDLLGQNIYAAKTDKESTAVDLVAQSKGVYFYRISDGGSAIQQGKIVKE